MRPHRRTWLRPREPLRPVLSYRHADIVAIRAASARRERNLLRKWLARRTRVASLKLLTLEKQRGRMPLVRFERALEELQVELRTLDQVLAWLADREPMRDRT